MPEPKNNFVEKALRTIRNEFIITKKESIKPWQAWLILGIAAGVAAGVFYVANREGEFETAKAAIQCEVYSEEVLIDCDYDIFGNRHCSPVGSVSGCNYDHDDFEPIYCWVNQTYCYDIPDITPPVDTIISTDFPDPTEQITEADLDIINNADVWDDFDQTIDPTFTAANLEAGQDFFSDCPSCQIDATEDFVDNFDDPEMAEGEEEVTVLTNEGQSSNLEEAAIEGALTLCDPQDCSNVIDDTRGMTDEELAELEAREQDSDVEARVPAAPIDKATAPCVDVVAPPNIAIVNCGLSSSQLIEWENNLYIGLNNFAEDFQNLVYNGRIPIIIFANHSDYARFRVDVRASKGELSTLDDFSDSCAVSMTAAAPWESLIAFSNSACSAVPRGWDPHVYNIVHELVHAAIRFRFNETFPEGGLEGRIIASQNRSRAFWPVVATVTEGPWTVYQTRPCLTWYACYTNAEYWAETGAHFIMSNGTIVPQDVPSGTGPSAFLYGSRSVNFLIAEGIFKMLPRSPGGMRAPAQITPQADLQLDSPIIEPSFDLLNFGDKLSNLAQVAAPDMTSLAAPTTPNEMKVAFNELQKLTNVFQTISDQAGLVTEGQVNAAMGAIVPGVGQWLDLEVSDFGAHRYWRFLDQGSGTQMQISEIAISEFSIANLAPLAGTPIYFAPGVLPTMLTVKKAFDSNAQNLLTLKSFPNATYIGLDFGSPKNIRGVSLYSHANTKKFIAKLQYSDDKNTWNDTDVSVSILVAPKNAANISFAKNVVHEAAKLKNRAYGFSRLNPIYGETRDAFVSGKTSAGKSAMTKDFELLLKGALNAADARHESWFANNSQDAAILPFTSLTEALQYSSVVLSEHASLPSVFIEQNIFTSALAGSKVKIKKDLKNTLNEIATTTSLSIPVWKEAQDAYIDAKAAYAEIASILKVAPPDLKLKIQPIAVQAALNFKETKLAKNRALLQKERISDARTYVNGVFGNATLLSSAIMTQAKAISTKTAAVMNSEGALLKAANLQYAPAISAVKKAFNSTSAAIQRSQLSSVAKNVQKTTMRLDGVFSTKTEPLYSQYVALAKQARLLAMRKARLKKSVDSWGVVVDMDRVSKQKLKSEMALEALKKAALDTKISAKKVQDNLVAVKALVP